MPDLAILQVEFQQTINHAKMLIRDGRVDEALQLIDELETQSTSYIDDFPSHLRYLVPFSRARAYVQRTQPDLARIELEHALELAGSDAEAIARTQNLLGAVFYVMSQPALALQCHLASIHALSSEHVIEFSFHVSLYRNIANAYWALNDLPHAIGAYKNALRLLKDANSPDKQAAIFWGLASCYKALNIKRYARLYMARAIKVYQAIGNQEAEAAMHINLAEVLIEEERLDEAKQTLTYAQDLIQRTTNNSLLSFMYRYYTDIARKEGDLQLAKRHAETALRHAELVLQVGQTDVELWADPLRAYVEALQGSALVHEALGDPATSDSLFQQAFALIEQSTVEETRKSLHMNYAGILEARGEYQQAAHHYKQAANRCSTRE